MILETIKDQEYHKKILLANNSYAEIERKEGTQLIINVDYKGVYGLGEKFDAVNQKGKTVETQVIEQSRLIMQFDGRYRANPKSMYLRVQ